MSQSGTPIIIDTKGEGFHLTDIDHGVPFTFFPDRPAVRISWADANYSNGWLALDRNGNGKIDDATELFGNLTEQPPSSVLNGYAALAMFDDPQEGGNGNGIIDPGDRVFDKLLVWIDSNHDGVSQARELHSLRDVGVFAIALHYSGSEYTDKFGNKFRFKSQILDKAGVAHDTCYDVFLQFAVPPPRSRGGYSTNDERTLVRMSVSFRIIVPCLVFFARAIAAPPCQVLDGEAQKKLISFVDKKYKIPTELPLRLIEEGFVGDSCYRRLHFVANASPQFFDQAMILAPDQVFLFTSISDSREDPAIAQKEQDGALVAGLTRGAPPSRGQANAPTTIVVFSDFECPFCRNANLVFKEVMGGGTDEVRLVFRNYPLPFHPWAAKAALSAACAAEQNTMAFWQVHDFLFDKQGKITPENVLREARAGLAGAPGIDLARYDKCLSEPSTQSKIDEDLALGAATGVEGTPSIFVNGRRFNGPLTAARLRALIVQTRF